MTPYGLVLLDDVLFFQNMMRFHFFSFSFQVIQHGLSSFDCEQACNVVLSTFGQSYGDIGGHTKSFTDKHAVPLVLSCSLRCTEHFTMPHTTTEGILKGMIFFLLVQILSDTSTDELMSLAAREGCDHQAVFVGESVIPQGSQTIWGASHFKRETPTVFCFLVKGVSALRTPVLPFWIQLRPWRAHGHARATEKMGVNLEVLVLGYCLLQTHNLWCMYI